MHALVGVHYFALRLQLYLYFRAQGYWVSCFFLKFCALRFTSVKNKYSAVTPAHRWTFADNVLHLRE